MISVKVLSLASLAMAAFAANSVLTRLGLSTADMDPGLFTAVRLASGALVLAALAWVGSRRRQRASWLRVGSWWSAALLVAYAAGFSFAYVSLGAATGALVMFAVVQLVMFSAALRSGERPGAITWVGLAVATLGLVVLAAPGASAPDAGGVALMTGAGLAWAGYTLAGRGVLRPLDATASNFVRGLPIVAAVAVPAVLMGYGPVGWSGVGVWSAVLSGAVASGLGYALWYSVLPHLSRAQSGIIQLSPAPIAAIGGLILIGEAITARVFVASVLILGGVAMGLLHRQRPAVPRLSKD